MKKAITLLFLGGFVNLLQAQLYIKAIGLVNPSEEWPYYYSNYLQVSDESHFGFTTHKIHSEYQWYVPYWVSPPSYQPFQIVITTKLPEDAVVTEASFFYFNQWFSAQPEDVFTAEDLYDSTGAYVPHFLMRQLVRRDYYGNLGKTIEILCAPVFYPNDIMIRLTYVDTNSPSIFTMRTTIPARSAFFIPRDYGDSFLYTFRDLEFPSSQPQFIANFRSKPTFSYQNERWETTLSDANISYYYAPLLEWRRPVSLLPELRLTEKNGQKFYHLLMLPSVGPGERQQRKILVLFDLGENSSYRLSREEMMFEMQSVAANTLSLTDSINAMAMQDLAPITFSERFLPATNENVQDLFDHLRQVPASQMGALPQLLRAAKDYFNQQQTGGELWILSNSTDYGNPPAKANEIIDLSWRKMLYPVVVKTMDNSGGWNNYYNVNGRYYYNNEYLYENLARLSGGGHFQTWRVNDYDVQLNAHDLFSPAADLMVVDPVPTAGFAYSRYLREPERTHYPVLYPYQEIGKYQGGDIDIEFFAHVDDHPFHKVLTQIDTIYSAKNYLISQLWCDARVQDMLQEPQSYETIAEIGELCKEYHILSPYCGFVVPSASGYKGFKRLTELDTMQVAAEQGTVAMPDDFTLFAYPNPFNSRVTIHLSLANQQKNEKMSLTIYDILGRTLLSKELDLYVGDSQLTFSWDGTDEQNNPVSSGIYFVRCSTVNRSELVKITFVK
jgi:hypothetical protein